MVVEVIGKLKEGSYSPLSLKISVERVGSILVVISPIILLVGLVLPYIEFDFYFHAVTMVVGGFTIFCTGVVFPLFSSIAGGRPRGGLEGFLLVVSIVSLLFSFFLFFVYGFFLLVIFLSVFLVSALVFVFLQVYNSGVGGNLRFVLLYPFVSGLVVVFGFIFGFFSQLGFLLAYSFSFVSSLVMVVGGFFLSSVYGGVNRPVFVVSFVLNFFLVLLFLFGVVQVSMVVFLHSLSLFVYLVSLGFWRGFSSRFPLVRSLFYGHFFQFVSVVLYFVSSLLFGLGSLSLFVPLHSLLVGFVSIGVFSQAILLSPLVIASSRGRLRGWVFPLPQLLLFFSVVARFFSLDLSFLLYFSGFIVLLFGINPSIKRLIVILRFGTERGYAMLVGMD